MIKLTGITFKTMLHYHAVQHGKTIHYFKKTSAILEKIYPPNEPHVMTTRNDIIANSQMAAFDQQSAEHDAKIMKFDYTRHL